MKKWRQQQQIRYNLQRFTIQLLNKSNVEFDRWHLWIVPYHRLFLFVIYSPHWWPKTTQQIDLDKCKWHLKPHAHIQTDTKKIYLLSHWMSHHSTHFTICKHFTSCKQLRDFFVSIKSSHSHVLRYFQLFVSLCLCVRCGGEQFYVITTMRHIVRSFFCINDNQIHTHRWAYECELVCIWMFKYTLSLFMNYDSVNDSFGLFGFILTLFSNFSVWTIIINICFILCRRFLFGLEI